MTVEVIKVKRLSIPNTESFPEGDLVVKVLCGSQRFQTDAKSTSSTVNWSELFTVSKDNNNFEEIVFEIWNERFIASAAFRVDSETERDFVVRHFQLQDRKGREMKDPRTGKAAELVVEIGYEGSLAKGMDVHNDEGPWDLEQCQKFEEEIKKDIRNMLGNERLDEIKNKVQDIVNMVMDKLEQKDHQKYKYVCDAIILPIESGYQKDSAFWWSPQTDASLKAQVTSRYLRCLLRVYCIQV